MTSSNYAALLERKLRHNLTSGIEVKESDLSQVLYPFQRAIARWALRKGRAAIFADCGLGKTLMQLEWARHVPGRVIILAPLCVEGQTIAEAEKLGMLVVPHGSDDGNAEIVNYERLHQIDADRYAGVVLDESSILKAIDGKTRRALTDAFSATPYRLCCTATPAPNDRAEIGNHAEFLGILTQAEMLASFFVNKGEGNRSWALKGHAHEAFYRWMASWAMFIGKPSDLGFEDEGFALPELTVEAAIVGKPAPKGGNLFGAELKGIQDRLRIRRETLDDRVDAAVNLLNEAETQGYQAIAWCGLNAEQDAVADALGTSCVSVQGSDTEQNKRSRVAAFLSGEARILVSKPDIVGFGMNFQCAARQVFVGIGDSYEAYYQAIRRSWRFGQKQPVKVHIVVSDVEIEIVSNVQRKEQMAQKTQGEMVARMVGYEREDLEGAKVKSEYVERTTTGPDWSLTNGDCVEGLRGLPAASVDLAVFSPPFSSLYTYSASERDLGNSRNADEFFEQFGFVISELLRVVKPGRNVCCHCQQLTSTKATHGVIGLKDFRGDLIRAFLSGGFIYHGEVCIDKDPQAQAIRTKSKGLLFVQLEKDSTWSRPALADYILLFRAPGDNVEPVKPELTREEWIEWARPIWYGIRESDTLSAAEARTEKDEKHICPLQLGTIERCIRLWTNRGDTVLSPFAGIGSEGYVAISNGRKFVGFELKKEYAETACTNLRRAEQKNAAGSLFGHANE